MNLSDFEEAEANGDIEICPSCNARNAYDWDGANMLNGKRMEGTEDWYFAVYHIPAASGYEWQCGACGLNWTPIDSPLNQEVYTHIEERDEDNE